jgi:hypothetical protein
VLCLTQSVADYLKGGVPKVFVRRCESFEQERIEDFS